MRRILVTLFILGIGAAVAACDNAKLSDPNDLLPPGDRPARGPGLFSGEDGVLTIPLPE